MTKGHTGMMAKNDVVEKRIGLICEFDLRFRLAKIYENAEDMSELAVWARNNGLGFGAVRARHAAEEIAKKLNAEVVV